MTIADVYGCAASLLTERGKCAGQAWDEDVSLCAWQALKLACHDSDGTLDRELLKRAHNHLTHAVGMCVTAWSDRNSTEYVVASLRALAATLRATNPNGPRTYRLLDAEAE